MKPQERQERLDLIDSHEKSVSLSRLRWQPHRQFLRADNTMRRYEERAKRVEHDGTITTNLPDCSLLYGDETAPDREGRCIGSAGSEAHGAGNDQ